MREGGIKEGGSTEATGVIWEHCLALIRWGSWSVISIAAVRWGQADHTLSVEETAAENGLIHEEMFGYTWAQGVVVGLCTW